MVFTLSTGWQNCWVLCCMYSSDEFWLHQARCPLETHFSYDSPALSLLVWPTANHITTSHWVWWEICLTKKFSKTAEPFMGSALFFSCKHFEGGKRSGGVLSRGFCCQNYYSFLFWGFGYAWVVCFIVFENSGKAKKKNTKENTPPNQMFVEAKPIYARKKKKTCEKFSSLSFDTGSCLANT